MYYAAVSIMLHSGSLDQTTDSAHSTESAQTVGLELLNRVAISPDRKNVSPMSAGSGGGTNDEPISQRPVVKRHTCAPTAW